MDNKRQSGCMSCVVDGNLWYTCSLCDMLDEIKCAHYYQDGGYCAWKRYSDGACTCPSAIVELQDTHKADETLRMVAAALARQNVCRRRLICLARKRETACRECWYQHLVRRTQRENKA